MPTLTFDLTPSTDPELTCFFCGKTEIDHEFHYKQDDWYGGRQHVGVGVHLKCTTDPTYMPYRDDGHVRRRKLHQRDLDYRYNDAGQVVGYVCSKCALPISLKDLDCPHCKEELKG